MIFDSISVGQFPKQPSQSAGIGKEPIDGRKGFIEIGWNMNQRRLMRSSCRANTVQYTNSSLA
jgi:hypothetical protein